MIKHNLKHKYFHGCGDCRDCCNGKLFSMGKVTFSDFKKIIKLFPTVFDIEQKQFLFLYSLAPLLGCHYFRNNNCSVYETMDRPNTCLNFPFGLDRDQKIYANYYECKQLNDDENDFPVLIDKEINPKIMNNFFTEHQYVSTIQNKDIQLDNFIELVFKSNVLIPIPKFKTVDDEFIDINELDANRNLRIIDTERLLKITKKMNIPVFDIFIQGHELSLENLPRFGKRLLEQLQENQNEI